MTTGRHDRSELIAVRRAVAALFLFGSLGTGVELLLLEHTEGVWQVVPLLLIATGSALLFLLVVKPGMVGLQIFRLLMALFVLSGIAGVTLHYQGNVEFERELQPDATGLALFWEAMKGATPALAPATMILLGALGWLYTYMLWPPLTGGTVPPEA